MPETFGTVVIVAPDSIANRIDKKTIERKESLAAIFELPVDVVKNFNLSFDDIKQHHNAVCLDYNNSEWKTVIRLITKEASVCAWLVEGDEYGGYTFLHKRPAQTLNSFHIDCEGDDWDEPDYQAACKSKFKAFVESIPSDIQSAFPSIVSDVLGLNG